MKSVRNEEQARRLTAVARAVGAFVVAVASVTAVQAQSTAVGSVYGDVASGAGDQVLVENPSVGFKRIAAVSGNRFQLGALPPGRYVVQLLKDGKPVSKVEVEVLAGQGAEAVFAAAGTQQIEVVGRIKRIDMSDTQNASTFTAKQLDALPVTTKNLDGIIALAANTTKADTRYAGGASIGGGAPSENSYYINGMPVTNALTQLGSIELPFGAIAQADVQTGGFGAEFGRSVGGVVNIITKSGTNEWHGGANLSIEPNSLRGKDKNIYLLDGSLYLWKEKNTRSETSYGGYVGGPIVQDKLFMFFAADRTTTKSSAISGANGSSTVGTSGWRDTEDINTRYLGKFDWLLTQDHRIEATFLGDNYKTTDDYSSFDYTTLSKGGYVYSEYSKNLANVTPAVGGEAQMVKYTGFLTPDLTLTALYGQSSSKHRDGFSFEATSPTIFWSAETQKNPTLTYPTRAANPLAGGTTSIGQGAQEKTKSFRLDVDYKIGDHSLRLGIDSNRLKSINAGDNYSNTGGAYFRYFRTSNPDFTPSGGSIARLGDIAVPVNVGGTDYYYYVRKRIFDDVTNAQSNQTAQYIEDTWQVNKDVMLKLGLRREGFENKNGDGETFLESKGFISPRFAGSWNVNGDSSFKLFGSAGRYSLQIPTHIAVRGASRSLFTDEFFAYTGVDPITGAPTGMTRLSNAHSPNNEYGQAKDAKTVAALDMKPTYQDEITLGFEKALTPEFTGGASLTYRKLKATIDDLCDYRPFNKYAVDNSIDTTNWGGFGCASFNPGMDNTFLVDYSGNKQYTTVKLSAAELGFPKAKRTYTALNLWLEHPLRDGWYGKVTYTWSKSRGNTEGQTKSDNAQTDVAATSTWDTPELMENIYGPLPNDRTHQIKAFGFVELTPEWQLGGALRAESGRPKNCNGNYKYVTGNELDGGNLDYGSVYFYCSFDGVTQVATPRGSQGRLPWNFSIDLGATYKPSMVKGLSLRMDVFNVFNRQTAVVIDETHETAFDYSSILSTYGRVISYSEPRKVRFTASYEF